MRFTKLILPTILVFCCSEGLFPRQLAFPTAEGFGKYTVGGRGGQVFKVTNLNDSGPGSLRAAVNASGPRTVVFRVSGIIALKSSLDINRPYITIAGQTAPGDGICLKNYPININTNQVIIRYLRLRLGDESGTESDALSSRYTKNIIVDHVSASWSVDETLSIYHCDSVTVQWCLISESMYNSNHAKGHHGYGGIWGGPNASFHHNLLAHHSSRNPRFSSGCGNTDFRNNVIYNWGYQSVYGGEQVQQNSTTYLFSAINMVANYYKQGPGTRGGSTQYRIVRPSSRNYLADYGAWYVTDNYVENYADVTADNWSRGVQPDDNTQTVRDSIKTDVPAPHIPIEQHTAEEAYVLVLQNAGAILPRRDPVDVRIIQEATDGTATYGTGTYNQDSGLGSRASGIIDSQTDVGGWPDLFTGPAPEDRDHDGMPDSWETANGLNSDDPEDRNGIGKDGYTYLEIYLNSIIEFPAFLAPPTNVVAELTGYTDVNLTWNDDVDEEIGFRIERAESDTGSFVVIAELGANETSYLDTGLAELTLYRYRVSAFNDSLVSGYERIVSITTLSPTSAPLAVSDPCPDNNAVYVVTAPSLTWKESMNAESYDIYFGTTNSPPFITNQVETKFEPGELAKGVKYYWRIDGVNANGTTEGPLWRFTVVPEIPSGQIVQWMFDETEGITVADEGEYGLDGVLVNMDESSWTEGIQNGGLWFDGLDDYVLVPHSGIIDFADESFSLSAWIKAEPLTGNSMYLINKGSFSNNEAAGTTGRWYGIEIKNNELRFAIDDDDTKSQATVINADVFLSEKWAYIVGVRDTAKDVLRLYVNGEMMASISDATGNISQEEYMTLGNSTTGTAPFAGVMDEVRLYNYALGDAEVQAIYSRMTGIAGTAGSRPTDFFLAQNYPNPFNPSTTIEYDLPKASHIQLSIYDMLGRKVKQLLNERRSAGRHSISWDGTDKLGCSVAAGLYFCRMEADGFTEVIKMALIR